MKTKDMTLVAVMAALLCVAGPLSIGQPVPLSLCSFAVYMAGIVLGWRKGALAVLVYLLIGLVGVPVFSGFTGGFQKIAGLTGGYLMGYLPCAALAGLGIRDGETRPRRACLLPLMLVAGTAALYVVGTGWFMVQSGNALTASLSLCVIPFLPGDAAKIAVASILAWPVRRAIYR